MPGDGKSERESGPSLRGFANGCFRTPISVSAEHQGSRHCDGVCPLPDGGQSGEQWVRIRFPEELRKIRRRQRTLLVVVIDADVGSTGDRHTQLEQQCREVGVERRTAEDSVIVAVPRRNIETWFEYLRGSPVDETIDYPRLRSEGDCKPLADRLHGMCYEQQRLDEPAPPSLREVCEEYGRLRRN